MTFKQRNWILAIAAILLIGIITYGGISLASKMNKVDELNGKIADAEGPIEGDPTPTPLPDATDDPTGEPGDSPTDATDPSESGQPQTPSSKPSEKPGTNGGATPGNTTSPEATPKPTSPPGSNGGSGDKPTVTPSPDDKAKKKKEIDAATTASMEKLSASCKATSTKLVNQIVAQLKADEDASAESIQGDFLGDVIAAEANCDVQFNSLLAQAKTKYQEAGLDDQTMPDWSSQYESAKAAARAEALGAVTGAMN